MQNRLFLVSLFFLMAVAGTSAQYGNEFYLADKEIVPADSQQLFLRFGSATFINNKESFNPYQPGYTLIGYFIRPVLEYYPGSNTRLSAGVHLLKYSGLGKYHQAIPLFTLHHKFRGGLEMVVGSLYGSLNHGLIEPIFSFDRFFTHHNESGLQFLLNRSFIEADAWLNWERFIFSGDPFQEEFTAGFSSKIFPGDREVGLRFEIPMQLVATHKGGQIDASDESLQTLVNVAMGLHAELDLDNSFIEMIGFRGYLAGFRDLSNRIRHHYDSGWGIYPNIVLKTRLLEGGVGYWVGNKFISPRGEPVFQSVSQVDPFLVEDHRELLTSKLVFNRRLVRGVNMALRFELYYDHPARQLDHTGGLHIVVDERFFLSGLQKR